METLNIADAKSRFSELVSRVSSGENFTIRRREKPVAVLISPEEYQRLERLAQSANRLALALGQDEVIIQQIEDGDAHPAMAAYGLWADEDELDDLIDRIYAARITATRSTGDER